MLLHKVDRLLCGGVFILCARSIGESTWVVFLLRKEQAAAQKKCAHFANDVLCCVWWSVPFDQVLSDIPTTFDDGLPYCSDEPGADPSNETVQL